MTARPSTGGPPADVDHPGRHGGRHFPLRWLALLIFRRFPVLVVSRIFGALVL